MLKSDVDEPLRINVMASGEVLLNDEPVSLLELDDALKEAKRDEIPIHYFRQNPESPASPEAEAVVKLIAANRLSMAMSTSPQPEAPAAKKVIAFPAFENLFSKVRKQAAANRGVSIVRPDGKHFMLPPPEAGSMAPRWIAVVEAIVSSNPPRNIAVVLPAGTFEGDPSEPPKLPQVARQVPFFGLLIGLAYVGHTVWALEAEPIMLKAASTDADVLLIDSHAIASLMPGWQEIVAKAMRNANILVFDRAKEKLGALRTAGETPGRIAFPVQ